MKCKNNLTLHENERWLLIKINENKGILWFDDRKTARITMKHLFDLHYVDISHEFYEEFNYESYEIYYSLTEKGEKLQWVGLNKWP